MVADFKFSLVQPKYSNVYDFLIITKKMQLFLIIYL